MKKKLISTKIKIFMTFLLVTSILCYTTALIQLNNSSFKLSNYFNLNEYNFTNWNLNTNTTLSGDEVLSKDINLTDIDTIDINFNNNYTVIETYPGDKLNITAYSTYYSEAITETMDIISNSIDNKILNLSTTTDLNNSNEFKNSISFLIKIPYSFLNNTNINIGSGNININNLNLKNLNIKTSSANIYINNLNSDNANISSTSGYIITNKFNTNKISLHNVSGNISSTSIIGDATISTISGNVSILASTNLNTLDIDSNSGNVHFSVSENSNISLNYSTISGDFYKSNDNSNNYGKNISLTFGDGSKKVNIKTVNGNLILEN